jgi:branched-chain amino acid transport system ATP-binding protein
VLRVRNLDVAYGPVAALRRVSLHVDQGEIAAIIGANGAGKSTLLRCLAGLTPARQGEVLFRGEPVLGFRPERMVGLFAALPVKENLLIGGSVRVRRGLRREVEADLAHVYQLFPRLLERERQLAGTLSGGEQQMLAIGRALMARPALVMLDEPSMGLAPLVVRDILATVVRIAAEGTTVLLVEQNARSALRVARRGYVLENGRVVLEGTSEELLANRDVQRAYLGSEVIP